MERHPLDAINIASSLIKIGFIKIHENEKEYISVEGTQTKSPISIHYGTIRQPKTLLPLAERIASMIRQHNFDALVHGKGKEIVAISGPTNGYVAIKVCEILGRYEFLTEIYGKYKEINLKQNQQVAFITDVINTGRRTTESIHLMSKANLFCENVYSIFDFCFYSTGKKLENMKVESLVDSNDFTYRENVKKWINNNPNMFNVKKMASTEKSKNILVS